MKLTSPSKFYLLLVNENLLHWEFCIEKTVEPASFHDIGARSVVQVLIWC